MKKTSLLLILTFILFQVTYGSTQDLIKIQIKGISNTELIFASYYGNTFQIIDTLRCTNGEIIIKKDKNLNKGVYSIAQLDKSKIFDLIIDEDETFSINIDIKDPISSVKSVGSYQNEIFYKYMKVKNQLYKLNQEIKSKEENEELKSRREKANRDLNNLLKLVEKDLPNSTLQLIFKAMQDPQPPKEFLYNQRKAYEYYKNNYWNYIALDDDRMIRTPIFQKKLDRFFDQIVMQQADTLIKELDIFLNKDIAPETYKYLLWYLTYKYEQPKIMGLDKVFVHLANKYYENNNKIELKESTIRATINRAKQASKTLIGATAANLIMTNTKGDFDALYNYNDKDFTIILFWDPDCQSCKKEIAQLKKLYQNPNRNFEIFAVATDLNSEKWKKYIKDKDLKWINVNGTRSLSADYHDLYNIYMTPTIYIVDQNMKIVAKNLSADQIDGFLKHYKSHNNK